MVVVIGDDVPGQLAPYDENLDVEPYWRLAATDPSQFYMFSHLVEEKGLPQHASMAETLAAAIAAGMDDGERYRVTEVGELECESTYNPNSKWDWWVVGGRWEGFFLHVADHWVDEITKGFWDLTRQRNLARRRAEETYNKFEKLTEGLPLPGRFTAWVERLEVDMGAEAALNKARADYRVHPFITALSSQEGFMPWMGDPYDEWHLDAEDPRESYITSQTLSTGVPFAYVLNGEWHERGHMGWFGMASNEMPEDVWDVEVSAIYDSLDPDTLLTNCDCHI